MNIVIKEKPQEVWPRLIEIEPNKLYFSAGCLFVKTSDDDIVRIGVGCVHIAPQNDKTWDSNYRVIPVDSVVISQPFE